MFDSAVYRIAHRETRRQWLAILALALVALLYLPFFAIPSILRQGRAFFLPRSASPWRSA